VQVRVVESFRFPVVDGREYNGKYGWLGGRWLFKLLSRPRHRYEESLKVVDLNVQGLKEAILKQQEVCEWIWHREVEMIVVGPDVYNDLWKLKQPLVLNLSFDLTDGHRRETFNGIPVRFVPYATGILCIPKDGR